MGRRILSSIYFHEQDRPTLHELERNRGSDPSLRRSAEPRLLSSVLNITQEDAMSVTRDPVRERLEREPAVQRVLLEMEVSRREVERKQVEADPEAHKTTRLMEKTNFRYWPAKHKLPDGAKVSFCYTTGRNRAGYFLSFREVWDAEKDEGYRDKWVAHKRRKGASYHAERSRDVHDEKALARMLAALPEADPEVREALDKMID